MADETPPLDYFRAYFAKDLAKEIDKLAAEAMFDRSLAAHDAEKRSEWEAEQGAEEPEWEYGNEQMLHSHTVIVPASSEALATAQAWLWPVHRRRKAGPWVPVKQEGAADA